MTLSLSIEGASLRLLVCQGRKAIAWSLTPVSPRLLRNGFVASPEGIAGVIKEAVTGKKEFAGERGVIAALPAFHSVSRIINVPDLPGVRPEEVIPQHARRDMGYPSGNSLLKWQRLPSLAGQHSYFVVSVPREPVMALMHALSLAGLAASKIDTTTFALSRAVNSPEAIIASVEPDSLESIILRDSIPLAARSTFMGSSTQPGAMPGLVTDALDRIISFYTESNPDKSLAHDIPVYLLGSALSPEVTAAVETFLGRSVAPFQPPLLCPAGFPGAEMAVNVGLVLKEL
ncbi:MAG: hypothetical protein HYX91_04775 [Chloroflexi bacterium]|nr:hypothetical protein [Chloroflexota bacterium]